MDGGPAGERGIIREAAFSRGAPGCRKKSVSGVQ
jgi:hypothetical protein